MTASTDCRCLRIDGEALLAALTTAPASTALMETARSRLAITHRSRRLQYAPPLAEAAVAEPVELA